MINDCLAVKIVLAFFGCTCNSPEYTWASRNEPVNQGHAISTIFHIFQINKQSRSLWFNLSCQIKSTRFYKNPLQTHESIGPKLTRKCKTGGASIATWHSDIFLYYENWQVRGPVFLEFETDFNETSNINWILHNKSSGMVYFLFKWKNQKSMPSLKRSTVEKSRRLGWRGENRNL